MPGDIPGVQIEKVYGTGGAYPTEPEAVSAVVLECRKGTIDVPVLITGGRQDMYKQFKVDMPELFACGAKATWGVAARAGTPVKAAEKVYDNASTAVETGEIVAKYEGDYDIFYSMISDASGNTLIVEEDGFETEKYFGATIEEVITEANAVSEIIAFNFTAEGSGKFATVGRKKLGEGTGAAYTAGSNGTVKVDATDGTLADADAPVAHENALAKVEALDNPTPGIVFTIKDLTTVKAKYANHVTKMCSPLEGKPRIAILGAADDLTVDQRITEARNYNEEELVFVGHSAIDRDGTYYAPNRMTAAVAGKICGTPYNESVWGGSINDILGIDGKNFFQDVGEALTNNEIGRLNAAGVMTFKRFKYGIGIRDGVTTAQASKARTDSDSLLTVRITQHAVRAVQEAAEEMLGQRITPTFENDLKKACSEPLEVMYSTDGALVRIEDEGLEPYELDVSIIPRAKQKLGRADINFEITPAEANRKTYGKVVVR